MGSYSLTRALVVAFFSLLPALAETSPSVQANPAEVQGPENQSVADNLLALGRTALEHGDLAQAEKYYSESRATQESLDSGSLALANSLNGLGDVAEQRGDLPKAEEYYCQALAISRKLGPDGLTAASSLYGLGRADLDRTDFRKAEEYLRLALSIRRKLRPAGIEVAVALNALGDARRIAENWGEAERYYRQALTITSKSAPKGLISADSFAGLGTVAFFRADLKKAEIYHRRALAIRERLAPRSLAVANSLYRLSACCGHTLAKQKEYSRQALAIQEELAPNSLVLSSTLTLLSAKLSADWDLEKAWEYQCKALGIQQRLAPESLLAAISLYQLAWFSGQQGDYEGEKRYGRQALAIAEKVSPGGRTVALSLVTLGMVAYDLGDLAGADNYYRRAWSLRKRLDAFILAEVLSDQGFVAQERGDLSQAWKYYLHALVIRQRVQPDSLRVPYSLYQLGSLAYDRGQLAVAERYARRAVQMWDKLQPGTGHNNPGVTVLGKVAEARGDLGRAEQYYRQVWEDTKKSAPGSLEDFYDLQHLADVLCKRGELAEAETHYRSALTIAERLIPQRIYHAEILSGLAGIMRKRGRLEDAAQFYEQALNVLEAETSRLGGGDELRSNFRANHARYYTDYVDLLITRNQPELAFQIHERFRAHTLLEMLASAHVDIRQGVDLSLLQRERTVEQSLTAASQRRIRLFSQKHTEEQAAAINRNIEDLLAQSAEIEEEIRSTSPAYASLTQPQPIGATEVQQQLLDPNSLLLEYALGDEHSYLWAITADSVNAYVLPKRAEIERVAIQLYTAVTNPGEITRGENKEHWLVRRYVTERDYKKTAADLSSMILGPVVRQLMGKRLLIVSDDILQYIPFAALPAPSTGGNSLTFTPLVLDHEIVNLPSATVGVVLQHEAANRQPAPNALAVLADPVFELQDPRVSPGTAQQMAYRPLQQRGNNLSKSQLRRSLADVNGRTALNRLPLTRLEAEAILAVTPGEKMAALDFQANRATAISPILAHYRIVHFATHGLLDSKHPELSGLVLSMVNQQGKSQDGFLDLADIYSLKLSADLVVLSACKTGLGKQVKGEGLVGLTRGFMYAGAANVVASLWNVSDEATASLMEHFYRGMEEQGLGPSAALRHAQTSLLKERRWSPPYYWAGFQMYGEGRHVRPADRNAALKQSLGANCESCVSVK